MSRLRAAGWAIAATVALFGGLLILAGAAVLNSPREMPICPEASAWIRPAPECDHAYQMAERQRQRDVATQTIAAGSTVLIVLGLVLLIGNILPKPEPRPTTREERSAFDGKKKTAPEWTSAGSREPVAANVERVIVLYRDAAPRHDELRQFIEFVLGPEFGNVHVTASRVDEPTTDMAYAVVARLESDGTLSADALARASFQSLETSLGPVVVVIVWWTVPRDLFP